MSASPSADAAPRIFFECVLLPHRSMTPRGFHVLMLLLGLVSLAVGIGFVSIGAWPVCGFFGLDVALLYLPFRISYRSARRREPLRRLEPRLIVRRLSIRGGRGVWSFQAFCLGVGLGERRDDSNRLLVISHGRSLAI